MLIKILSPFLVLPLSFALPTSNSPSDCPANLPHSINIANESRYFDFAKTACEILFSPGYLNRGSRATTAHIWTEYNNNKDFFQAHRFAISGNVKAMDRQKCEYAFTSVEAQNANNDNKCQFAGAVALKGWKFEKDGRVYEMKVGDTAQVAAEGPPPEGVDVAQYQWDMSKSWNMS
ncbi:hypothetical protein BDV96DRAFT_648515 [Lophiotrema nucula]|uniref:Ecp2 effector protein domain-containing protein n=1 Tax=Lophiotrema nucula TaxID=690887 RepID=A0A6A5Z3J9_9PLEO|nr:hypothetical protein BDV96DRAFT_648515 [Lophiotrema nucula]